MFQKGKIVDLANKLRILRHESKLSQQQVADYLRISKAKYCRLEMSRGGNAVLSAEELAKLLELYHISFEQFMKMDFPIVKTEKVPSNLLDELEKSISGDTAKVTENWQYNRDKIKKIQDALEKVLQEREKFFDFAELDMDGIAKTGIIVKQINVDLRAEYLVQEALKVQKKFMDALF